MRQTNSKKKAQTLGELVILVAIVSAAVMSMQVYLKRGLEARYKKIADSATESLAYQYEDTGNDGIITAVSVSAIQQYEPYYNSSNFTTQHDSHTEFSQDLGVYTANTISETTTRKGSEKLGTDEAQDDTWN